MPRTTDRRERLQGEVLHHIRSSTSDVLVRLIPPARLALDQALELVREGEAVEVTPHAVRLRNRS
jgi:GTP-binding protein